MPPAPELQAIALGVVQGATELLPVSSSAHVAALPWLLGWDLAAWPPERRKELEVALHAGALLALAPALIRARPGPRTLALSLAPPVLAGYLLEGPIERRLGGPAALAAGLLSGALALAVADAAPQRRTWARGGMTTTGTAPRRHTRARGGATTTGTAPRRHTRARGGATAVGAALPQHAPREVGVADALALGLAQAAALAPGVSRSGATLAAARGRGFARADASALSFGVAGPVLAGATVLKAWRLRAAPGGHRRALAAGAAAAYAATALALRVAGVQRHAPLWPYAAERAVLAGGILAVRHRRAK